MNKICVLFAVFAALIFVVSCGGGNSKTGGEGGNSEKHAGELGSECYGNGTCNVGLLCDEESNTCVEDPENPTDGSDTSSEQTNDDVDTISGENEDNSHTSSENDNDSDTTPDNSDSQTDSDNGDTMTSDDPDSEIQCNPNPCKNVANSDQTCSTNINDEGYLNVDFPHSCGCNIGYVWDGAACIKKNLPECSPTSSTPCFDHETGFIWSKKTTEKMHWADAVDYCKTLNQENYGGFNDWRLPKIEVLRTLVKNCSSSDGCEGDTEGKYSKFGDIVFLWSSSGGSSEAQGVYFYNAASQSKSVDEIFDARCVRRETTSRNVNCYPLYIENTVYNSVSSITQEYDWEKAQWLPSFITHYDEEESATQCRFKCPDNNCNKDLITGLIWSERAEEKKNQSDASSYCNALEENGLQGWRLPDIARLGTLLLCFGYEDCKYNSFGDKDIKVWSSDSTASIVPGPGDGDVNIYFASAYMYFDGNSSYAMYTDDSNEYDVRCAKCEENYFWDSDSYKCVNPCDKNPCNYIGATGECVATNATEYTCGCKNNYFWDSSTHKCVNPCDANPCDHTGATGECSATNATEYTCGCKNNYFWDSSTHKCVNPCDANPCNSAAHSICTPKSSNQYKCSCDNESDGYFWSGSACVNPCDENPCSTIENSNGICISLSFNEHICKCYSGYNWRHQNCEIIPKAFGNICTGQDKCYGSSSVMEECSAIDADFYGQDAQYSNKCLAQSFTFGTAAQAGTVIDNITGLIWKKSPSTGTYTWDDAPNHCADLNSSNYGGKSNWRVPNPLELLTIVDNSKQNPATNSNFTGMPTYDDDNPYLWTSKEYKGYTNSAYIFDPSGCSAGGSGDEKSSVHKVLCVSGDEILPATSADFTTQTISGEVVVTDSKTGLMWQKEYVTGKTWQQALKYCEDLTYAGYTDWRLPNKNELYSLINYEKEPYSYFPDMPNRDFWSSSTFSDYPDFAWSMGFYCSRYKIESYNTAVRCVR